MGCSVFIRTTIIQATGCNFRVPKETAEFGVVIFFTFSEWFPLWDYSQLLAQVVMQTSPLTDTKIASSRFNFDVGVIWKTTKKEACFHTHKVIQKMLAQIWQTVQNWSDLGRKKTRFHSMPFEREQGKVRKDYKRWKWKAIRSLGVKVER